MEPSESDPLALADLVALSDALRRRVVSPVEVVGACLARIDAVDPIYRSFVTVARDESLAAARRAEDDIARGQWRGPLHGVPVAVKDLVFTQGMPTSGGSPIFEGVADDRDATIVTRLKAAGAVLVGKLKMTEAAFFAHHPSVEPPKNPWSPNHWTGASSSGPAVAVAAGLVAAAVGTDTGGSIRVPAACCGVTGLKPTFGRVTRDGVIPLADSLDHVGPMAPSAFAVAALLDAIDGPGRGVLDVVASLESSLKGLAIGIDPVFATHGVAETVVKAFEDTRRALATFGCEVRPIVFPETKMGMAAWARILAHEAWQSHQHSYEARRADYDPMLARFLDDARAMGQVGLQDAVFERSRFTDAVNKVFADVDLILMPTMPIGVPSLDETRRLIQNGETDRINQFTEVFNLSGHPAIAFPAGVSSEGLPISMQFVAPHHSDALLCRIVHAFQGATEWHAQRPCRHDVR